VIKIANTINGGRGVRISEKLNPHLGNRCSIHLSYGSELTLKP